MECFHYAGLKLMILVIKFIRIILDGQCQKVKQNIINLTLNDIFPKKLFFHTKNISYKDYNKENSWTYIMFNI